MPTVKEHLEQVSEKQKRLAVFYWIAKELDSHLMGHDFETPQGDPVGDDIIQEVYGDLMEQHVGPLEQEIEALLGEEVAS